MDALPLSLREVARIVNVWAAHGLVETTRSALAHWATETASLTPRLPRPELGIAGMLRLALAAEDANGTIRCTDALAASGTLFLPPDRVPEVLRTTILERLLRDEVYAAILREALGYATLMGGELTVIWRALPKNVQVNPTWLWLQELELAEHDGEIIHLHPVLRDVAVEADVRKPVMSQAELDERLAAQRLRAELAEEFIVTMERERLTKAGAPEYGESVRRVSIENALAGYDIDSYETDGQPRRIEVKCSVGDRERFFLSRNERESAERYGATYWIAWVGMAGRLPHGPCDVAWFREPARMWKASPTPWRLDYEDAIVVRVDDDAAYASKP